MSGIEWVLLVWLVVGICNVLLALFERKLLWVISSGEMVEGLIEVLFYLLLWPVQLAFWVFMRSVAAGDWISWKVWG